MSGITEASRHVVDGHSASQCASEGNHNNFYQRFLEDSRSVTQCITVGEGLDDSVYKHSSVLGRLGACIQSSCDCDMSSNGQEHIPLTRYVNHSTLMGDRESTHFHRTRLR